MSSFLPPYEKILEELVRRLKRPAGQIEEEIKIYGEGISEFVKGQQTWAAMYAQSKGIPIPVSVPTAGFRPSEPRFAKIAEITPNLANIDLYAYVVRDWKMLTSKKTNCHGVWLIDDTGFIQARVWGEDAQPIWEKAEVKLGDLVHIANVNIFQATEEAKMLVSFGKYSEVKKVEGKLPPLNDLALVSMANFPDGAFGGATGTLLSVIPSNEYIGCPNCMSSFGTSENIRVGQEIDCTRCGLVKSVKLVWHTAALTDGLGDLRVKLSPRLSDVTTKLQEYLYRFLTVYGIKSGGELELAYYVTHDGEGIPESASKFFESPVPEEEPEALAPPEANVDLDKAYEEVMASIVNSHPDLQRQNIENLVQAEIKKGGGFLTKIAAIHLVASSLMHPKTEAEAPKPEVPPIPTGETKTIPARQKLNEQAIKTYADYIENTLRRVGKASKEEVSVFLASQSRKNPTLPELVLPDIDEVLNYAIANGKIQMTQEGTTTYYNYKG